MPLLDHFHPPLSERRHWEGFHARWASAIADELNARLPEDYFAEVRVHPGARIEIDIAAFSESESGAAAGTGVQTIAAPTLAPADLVIPVVYPEEFAVRIFRNAGGPSLVAAIELVSPAHKDRAAHRRAFAVKCAAYLQQGVGLIVIDVVTNRNANLLRDLLELMEALERFAVPAQPLTAVSYRPVQQQEQGAIEARIFHLAVDHPLPTLPLALDAGQIVTVDFEAAYTEARARSRLGRVPPHRFRLSSVLHASRSALSEVPHFAVNNLMTTLPPFPRLPNGMDKEGFASIASATPRNA